MTTLYYETSDELCHYGVKGMKWGRRRYQNSDGSLTPAGKKRYITVRDGYNNARKAYKNAYNSSTEQSGGKKKGLVTIHESGKAKREARNSGRKAAIESVRNDKAANKEARNTPEAKAARRKKAIKAGAAVAGTALAAYGGYKLNQYMKNKNVEIAAARGKEETMSLFKRHAANIYSDSVSSRDDITRRFAMDLNPTAREYASNASNERFSTAAKNVVNYKRSGNSLKSLPKMHEYDGADIADLVVGKGGTYEYKRRR